MDNRIKFSNTLNDYQINVVLTKCFFDRGLIMMAEHIPNKTRVILKEYAIDKTNSDEYDSISYEIFVLRQLSHPNILPLLVTFVNEENLYLGMPLMAYGSCKDVIRRCLSSGFPESFIAVIIKDVLSGLAYLHSHGFVHRAIRASHIFLNHKKAVLGGLRDCIETVSHGRKTSKLHSLSPINKASLNWHAPEVLEQNLLGYNEKSDIYSIGITCCELTSGIKPYFNLEPTLMLTEKVKGNIPGLLDQLTCPEDNMLLDIKRNSTNENIYRNRKYSEDFHEFTELCTKKNPLCRWSADNLLNHSFLKQCRSTSLSYQLQTCNIKPFDMSKCIC